MMTYTVGVSQIIGVTVDETKFTPEFMAEFRKSFYQFHKIDDHIEHLAQLYARGFINNFSDFIEGYGDPKDFGIKFRESDFDLQIIDL